MNKSETFHSSSESGFVKQDEKSAAVKHEKGVTYVTLNPEHMRNLLFAIIAVLVGMSVIAHLLRFRYGLELGFGFVPFFDLNQESNLPTWFSVMLMVTCAIHLAFVAAMKTATADPWARHWTVLGHPLPVDVHG